MSYSRIRQVHGVNPVPGERVRHQVTERLGTIVPSSHANDYVHVRFDGQLHSTPAHAKALDYLGPVAPDEPPAPAAAAAASVALADRLATSMEQPAPNRAPESQHDRLTRLLARIKSTLPKAEERAGFVTHELRAAELIAAFQEEEGAMFRKRPDHRTYELRLADIRATSTWSRRGVLENWTINAVLRRELAKGAA